MSINDTVDWALDLGGGTTVALVRAGTFRSDAGALFGPVPRLLWDRWVSDELDPENRLLQALNCLLIQTPAGRVLVETGIGDRLDEKTRAMRGYEGPWIVPALADAGFDPSTVDVVAMSHLHFDHAGGLLAADGSRAFRQARIVAQRAEWEAALGDFPLTSVEVKASLFARAADEGWTIVLSHELRKPIGRLVRDRDRFAWDSL
jgi:glyoxylase-like metal-dependent hydrolase (beta-lactamase superfamily II)